MRVRILLLPRVRIQRLTNKTLSVISRPGTKALWEWEITSGSTTFSLLAITLEISIYRTVHKLISLSSLSFSGLSTLGIKRGADPVPEAPTWVGSVEGKNRGKPSPHKSAERLLRTQDLVTQWDSSHHCTGPPFQKKNEVKEFRDR